MTFLLLISMEKNQLVFDTMDNSTLQSKLLFSHVVSDCFLRQILKFQILDCSALATGTKLVLSLPTITVGHNWSFPFLFFPSLQTSWILWGLDTNACPFPFRDYSLLCLYFSFFQMFAPMNAFTFLSLIYCFRQQWRHFLFCYSVIAPMLQ